MVRKELITGKRYCAHNGNDAGDSDAANSSFIEIYSRQKTLFKETYFDQRFGCSLNIVVEDMNKDHRNLIS